MTINTKQKFKVIQVEGIAMYPSVHTPKKAFSGQGQPAKAPEYSTELIVDEETEKMLLAEGIKPTLMKVDELSKKVKEYPEHPGKKVFTFRKNSVKKDRQTGEVTTVPGPEVVDSEVRPIPKTVLIGNGSHVVLEINPYRYPAGNGYPAGTKAVLLTVQVLDLVPYVSSHGTSLKKRDGFKISENTEVLTQEDGGDEDPFDL